MRTTAAVVIILGLLLPACSSVTPVAIRAGEVCHSCGRTITNVKVAAEAIDSAGLPLKFRSVGCMAKYLTQHPGPMRGVFVTDYGTGKFVRAQNAVFVRAPIAEDPRELDYYAFTEVMRAVEFGKEHMTSPIDWFAIMQQTAAATTN
jgi:hypothetical protein